jgi:hypothetical protein
MSEARTHPDRILRSLPVLGAILLIGGCAELFSPPPPPDLQITEPHRAPEPPWALKLKLLLEDPTRRAFLPWRFGDPQDAASRIEVIDPMGNLVHRVYLVPTDGTPHPILTELERVRMKAVADGLPKILTDQLTIIADTSDEGTKLPDRYTILCSVFLEELSNPVTCYVELEE